MEKETLSSLFRYTVGRMFINRIYVLNVLNHMDCTDPKKRSLNRYDKKFIRLIPVLHNYHGALEFLNMYGYVSDTYFSHLTDAENNAYLQMRFCAVEKSVFDVGNYYPKYSNLVCYYLMRWDFLPEVKEKIFKDDKYCAVARIYYRFRKN